MTALQDRLNQEIKSAMLTRAVERLSTLRLLKSAFGYAAIELKTDSLSDEHATPIIQREIKKRRDAIEQYEKGGRPELAEKEQKEITVLETFLPAALSLPELEDLVQRTIQETGATSKKEMSQVIKGVQSKAGGRADGKTISGIVARLLGS